MTPYLPSHLSPSQFSCYALCPAVYHERYVEKIFPPPEPERFFGIAVHQALEAHYRGQDDELTFLSAWRQLLSEMDLSLYPGITALKGRGLDILGMVRNLQLEGEPEHKITLLVAGISVPIFGYTDLWADNLIVDFKTAGYGWTQAKADAQVFQPAIYSQAYADDHDGTLPRFQFVVLPRVPGPLQIFDATRTHTQIFQAFEQAREIHVAIEAQVFDCTCSGRYHRVDSQEAA